MTKLQTKHINLKVNKHIPVIIATMLILVVFHSCKRENMCDCIKRTGPIVTQQRPLNGFDELFVEDNLDVFITQDSVFEVVVEAGKNLRGMIITEVIDGTLYIKNNNRCNWARSYKEPHNIYIKMPVIKYITSNGTGNIKSLNTITTDSFDVRTKNSGNVELTVNNSLITSHMHGAGDLTLHGTTKEHLCDIGGTAFLKCQDLKTKHTYIHTFSIGLCYVNVSDDFECKIEEIGDVYCYGNPKTVDKKMSGKGQLFLNP
jgi:hypothetical protein